MGLQVVIDTAGVPQLNGTYDMDFEFTMGELSLVKEHAKLRGLELDDALGAGDTDLIMCFGLIGALRAGRLQPGHVRDAVEALKKEKVGTVSLLDDEPVEVEETPEASSGTPEPGETQSSSSETSETPSSVPSVDLPATRPLPTGVLT